MHNPFRSPSHKQTLRLYFVLTYLLVIAIASDSLDMHAAWDAGLWPLIFLTITFLIYGFFYLLPAIIVTAIASYLANRFRKTPASVTPAYIAAILTGGLTTLMLYANAKIFSLYGMFINGFVLNLLMTPGGVASLGGSSESDLGFALIAIGFVVLQVAVLYLSCVISQKSRLLDNIQRKTLMRGIYAALLLTVATHLIYAADSYSKNKLTPLVEYVPFYHPVSARHFFGMLGFKIDKNQQLSVQGKVNYPLHPLEIKTPAKPYNIIWLTSESWRADTLDAEVMPHTWQFAAQANRFTHNFSGGNGTRMGVFSMFMGIPGNYWFPFMKAHRGAAFIDVLQQQGYQMELFTSARFSYPEFDKTIFSQVPTEKLHSLDDGRMGWERDRSNVDKLLNFVDTRDPAKPFFTFMFFESPHARYHFPPEDAIKKPYRDDINYATLSKAELRDDIVPIKNRYINAVHHLDSQFGRIFDYLKEKNLLDNTIVILLGDHGEEFMEHGYWGHNSTFVDQQIMTPLVIWVPGKAAKVVSDMTSHLDIIPTIMPLLGVTNPVSDYALGFDLFSEHKRDFTYISDWSRVVYVDKDVKISQPVSIQGYAGKKISGANDEPIPADKIDSVMQSKQNAMLQTVQDLSKFLDKGKKSN